MLSFAVSLQDIRDNPDIYKLVFSSAKEEEYIDINSIQSIRYAPPYYTINATAYAVYYNQGLITVYDNQYSYDLTRSLRALVKNYPRESVISELKKDTGLNWRAQRESVYDFDGILKMNVTLDPTQINVFSPCHWASPSYQAANFIFLQVYNMYFNFPIKGQTF